MNSYGSVSLVSRAIYRFIHYMNWMDDDVVTAPTAPTAPIDAVVTDPNKDPNS